MKIKDIKAREIIDSRGNPTVEVDCILENGIVGRASVPSGASTGAREALELRDGGTRFMGKGVLPAVSNVNGPLRDLVIGREVENQKEIDYAMIELDGTETKSKFGANAILGVSMSVLKASALNSHKPLYKYVGDGETLPKPMMNIINGGAHADNKLDFQEFMIIPQRDTIKERVRVGAEVFHNLKKVLNERGLATGVGDEGGFAPDLQSNEEGFELIVEAIKKAGYIPGVDVCLGIDVAASEFNNALSIAEKRVFIVALHKLGIPILATPDSKFDIQNIVFEKREIDKDEIEAIISQIQLGHCDQLFYIEPDNYFSENIRLKTLRYIAQRWVREVFGKSKLDRSQNPIVIVYPTNWWLDYTLGERLGIAVLRERISLDEYFDEQGLPKEDSIERLITDIDRGLWDSSFFWDIENYRSVTATSSLNNMISQLLNNSQNSTIQKRER